MASNIPTVGPVGGAGDSGADYTSIPTVPELRENSNIIMGIQVTVKVAGLSYSGTWPIDAKPEDVAKAVAETIRLAPKRVQWIWDEYPEDPGYVSDTEK